MKLGKRITGVLIALAMMVLISIPAFAVQLEIIVDNNITVGLGEDVKGISITTNGRIWLVKSTETITDVTSLDDSQSRYAARSASVVADNPDATISTWRLAPGVYKIYATTEADVLYPVSDKTVTITSPFSGGTGTESDPFLISTALQLRVIGDLRYQYYALANDIDLSAEEDWEPIYFGWNNFEGNYHVISGLTIDDDSGNIGLFGSIYKSSVKHLGVINANIKGIQDVGILAGNVYDSHIEEVYTTGEVSGETLVGGLIGSYRMAKKTVQNCYSTATVKGMDEIGGLVGLMEESSILTSYSAGQVVAVDAPDEGDSKTLDIFVGGLLGVDEKNLEVPNTFIGNYYDSEVSGQSDSTAATGKTTAQMKTKATFLAGTGEAKWDFSDVWAISSNQNNGYPYLKGFVKTVPSLENKSDDVPEIVVEGVDGTTFDPTTVLSVKKITDKLSTDEKTEMNSGIALVSKGNELKELFDIKLLLNGVPVQPDGSVRVKIKLSAEYLAIENLQVAYIDSEGKVEIIPSKIVDGYLEFTVSHFSDYALVGKVSAVNPAPAPDPNPAPVPNTNPDTSDSQIPVVLLAFGAVSALSFAIIKAKKKA